jgi:hypothetical protein
MPNPGTVTLGQMAAMFAAAGLPMLEVSCNRCERRSRLSIARLPAERSHALPDVCGVHFPQMVALTP